MSVPRKGSRKIVVNDVEYLWLIRSKPTYSQECQESLMCAAVELNQKESNVLSITFPFQRPDSLMSSEKRSVTPGMIKSCILGALSQGWKPNERGSAFEYTHEL